jgi:hypothetical protein
MRVERSRRAVSCTMGTTRLAARCPSDGRQGHYASAFGSFLARWGEEAGHGSGEDERALGTADPVRVAVRQAAQPPVKLRPLQRPQDALCRPGTEQSRVERLFLRKGVGLTSDETGQW